MLGKGAFPEGTRQECAVYKSRFHYYLGGMAVLASAALASASEFEAENALVSDYCVMCHSDQSMTAGFSLESFDVSRAEEEAPLAEKMIRKLRAGMMPPSFAPQPDPTEIADLARTLEARIDEAAARNPDPGARTFQRLNRAEYARSIQELVGLDVDVSAFLPPDTISHGFDNVADVQTMSPTLMEGYLRAAGKISRLAVGDPAIGATEATYKVPRTASQMERVEGAPFGTRGGISMVHHFPADGEYVFKMMLHGSPTGQLYGAPAKDEQIEISIEGERVALLDIDPMMDESDPNGMNLESPRVFIKAGPRRVAAAFLQRFEAPLDDLMAPIEHTLADTTIGTDYGVKTLPHLREFRINGPHNVTGVSDTVSRRKIFTCRPTSAEDERPCAHEIVSDLAAKAYRRPLNEMDIEGLMSFYETGATEGDFESGIRTALQAILASPHFVFRLEEAPSEAEAEGIRRVNDLALASRLSFFLWASVPDEELVKLASDGKLSDPAVLTGQVERMLEDPRSDALATRFASQWLRLQDLDKIDPDYLYYPLYDDKLASALREETELFFENLVREDRSVLEVLTADYTFVNERLARHYGIPNVTGSLFRRVKLEDETRRGVLGQGSVLTLTSVADRTSPVNRGKWILEVFLGSPPPPPPPNVPDLEASREATGKALSVREAMELHRSNPACTSCHQVIDPLGLALENFDATGAWRIKDNGVPVDATGELYDGTPLDGPAGLREALLKYQDVFVTSFTESLMTYALGRRVEYYDMPTVRRITGTARENGYRISSFIQGIVGSPAFQMTRAPETIETAAGEVQ
jgi:cytochrome c551/c552